MEKNINYIKDELKQNYHPSEIDGFIHWIISELTSYSYTEMILNKSQILPDETHQKVKSIVERLKKNEPIQYIFGKTEFWDLELDVNSSVLIPRPETEEIVRFMVDHLAGKSPRILDIGTGSGCIALALKHHLPKSTIWACDVSKSALSVAKKNAMKLKLDVQFQELDILKPSPWDRTFDCIVSNPPYVRDSEKKQMEDNVLNHEPHLALFVKDEDPLLFYKAILKFAVEHLAEGGEIFFEINEALAKPMLETMKGAGFVDLSVRQDLGNKDRMVYGRYKLN